jgi:F0F1-type ATP synthase membrane subunit b/b'
VKSWRRWLSLAAGGLLNFFLTSIPTLAAEASEQNPADSPVGIIFRWLNFALVFGGIAYLIAKHGGAFFRGNAKAIASSIHEATADKAEADRELSEVNSKISRLDQEVSELREAARQGGLAEAERLRVSGRAEIEKIRQAAHGELDASERAAQHQLREMAASMAVEGAGVLIESRMNQGVRAKLFHSFLGDLGRSRN